MTKSSRHHILTSPEQFAGLPPRLTDIGGKHLRSEQAIVSGWPPGICVSAFLIEAQITDVLYKLKLPPHLQISLVFHASRLRPVVRRPLDEGVAIPSQPAAVEVKDAPAYRMHQSISKQRRGELEYLVDWKGSGTTYLIGTWWWNSTHLVPIYLALGVALLVLE